MLRGRILLLPFVVSILSAPAFSQTPDTATIHGQITDQSHAAVPEVQVTVTNTSTGLERTAQTDSAGSFSVGGLPISGNYDIVAHKEGFADSTMESLVLIARATADANMQLNVAGALGEVVVTGVES
jgi:type 1 fimbria pilin